MTAHVYISGFVQGVGFRRFVKHHALKLGLTGWVKNLSDNRVEAVFCGSKEQIEKITSACEKGSFFSEVKNVQISIENTKIDYTGFDIIS
jgi:acylphosphatase